MCAASAELCNNSTPPPWTERNTKLATAWLNDFARAVFRKDSAKIDKLFHPHASVFGREDFGPCDGVEAPHFQMNLNSAKFCPMDHAYVLATASWRIKSVVVNGQQHYGVSTFVLYITEPEGDSPGSIVCIH